MARKPIEDEGGGGGSWMDTYGDLVTLLLTFFVLLYSMSTVDAAKWDLFVLSIPKGAAAIEAAAKVLVDSEATKSTEGEEEDQVAGGLEGEPYQEELFLVLSEALQNAIEQTGEDTAISITRGEDYTFISFKDSLFFAGESSTLTTQGKQILDVFTSVIAEADELIGQINIMGHTAQAHADRENDTRVDRMLSAMRSAEVCIYVQNKDVIAPDKLVTIAYGQYRPVDTSNTAEGRALNRRVEMVLWDAGADIQDINKLYSEQTGNTDGSGETADQTAGDGFDHAQEVTPEHYASKQEPIPEPEGAGNVEQN